MKHYETWRSERINSLIGPQGILAEINRYFISESCSLAEIPGTWSPASEPQQGLLLSSSADDKIEVDGKIVDGTVLVTPSSAIRYTDRLTATVITPDGINYGIRIWDSDSAAIRKFDGISSYPYNPEWVVKAEYLPSSASRTVSFELFNQQGLTQELPSPGDIRFQINGESYELVTYAFFNQIVLTFKDLTNGRQTYEALRFLLIQPEADGTVVLDFNYAFLPPCAFNQSPLFPCPLPPAQNRLHFPIEAGEREPLFKDNQKA
ncbi:hypothetical protein SAMN04487895_10985 [Paenibacillus sophorae]|uniref:DUF1684 domain-containing protein n=1 Tax=Paenibacillus sophorae TaxID=1333845 RepID=A0A1H8R1A2_9BACL|nr:DUF1684 domain-containing protein [Paenibacillus sophorae]QWU14901.1 DUF1684 domain-containing protein [Paenibacillus sophorae]SEO59918.1 hypothetical protein SAMN04487895_10985 [Paenibacillus sophorae]